jgi:hypothetical protein
MGLKLRYNLFYDVLPQDVYDAYARFYAKRGQPLVDEGDAFSEFTLFEPNSGWTILDLDGGWEWEVRREAQLFASRELYCAGFLIYVFDGDYWGYELFKNGEVLDKFVQDPEDGNWLCPPGECQGNPDVIAALFPWLSTDEIAPYLVQKPTFDDERSDTDNLERLKLFWERKESLDVPPRPGDECNRFNECAVINLLRLLGIQVELQNGYVTLLTPKYRSFWVKYRQYISLRKAD